MRAEQSRAEQSRAEQSRAEQSRAEQTGFPSVDKPWLKYYSEEAIQEKLPECTMYDLIY